jgi:phage replication initiation protein
MVLKEKVFIDWCRFTFDVKSDEDAIEKATDFVCDVFGDFDLAPASVPGQMAYSGGVGYVFGVADHAVRVASLFYGGDNTRGTACIDINGRGCSIVGNWEVVRLWVEKLGGKLTRVDTALDFPDGEFTMKQAVRAYRRGEFNLQRKPACNLMGDWIDHQGKGRSLMIGQRQNGKQARIYEKGKQLGSVDSPWVRLEIEWLSKDRVLPFDVLTRPESYFAGGYPICARLLALGGERIKTLRLEWLYGLDVGRKNVRTQYGPMLFQLRGSYTSDAEMVADLQRPGCPKRLEKGALTERTNLVPRLQEIQDDQNRSQGSDRSQRGGDVEQDAQALQL